MVEAATKNISESALTDIPEGTGQGEVTGTVEVSATSLPGLEAAQDNACQAYMEQMQAAEEASAKAAEAKAAYQQAAAEFHADPYSAATMEKMEEAVRAMAAANAEAEAAQQLLEERAQEAQDACDAVEAKINELRESRTQDTTYVVHTARAECSCAPRYSYLALDETHGVYTRQIPQMTVGDVTEMVNIITFGRCKSKENPKVREAAEAVAQAAKEQIQNSQNWRDKLINLFFKPEEIKVTDSLIEECEGECIMEIPTGIDWLKAHGKMRISDKFPLMRKCELTCKYGGLITILLSGQPE